MSSVTINPKILRAAALMAPKDNIRYYLNGVLVEVTADAVYYVATNGHALIAFCEARPKNEEPYTPAAVIVPRDVARAIKPFKDTLGTLEHDGLAAATIKTMKGEQVFKPIDGQFPDWRRVVPVTCSGEQAQYNPELLAIFSAIGRELAKDKDAIPVVVVEPNGSSGGSPRGPVRKAMWASSCLGARGNTKASRLPGLIGHLLLKSARQPSAMFPALANLATGPPNGGFFVPAASL